MKLALLLFGIISGEERTTTEFKPIAFLQEATNTLKTETKELGSAAIHAPAAAAGVLMGPVRDSYQLLPWNDAPVVPTPESSEKFLGGSSLMHISKTPDDKAVWKYRVEGGGNFRYGNSNTNNVNAAFFGERRSAISSITGKFGATYNQLGDANANRRFFGDGLYDRFLGGRWIAFGRDEMENDQARRIDFRNVASAGLGYRFVDSEKARWIARTGPSVTYLRQSPDNEPTTSEVNAGWMLESEYRQVILENSRIEWTSTLFPNFAGDAQSFRFRNEVGLIFPIGGIKTCWNWKIGLRDELTEKPAAGTNAHDTEVYFAIVYASQ